MLKFVVSVLVLLTIAAALGVLVAVAAGLIWTPDRSDVARAEAHAVVQIAEALLAHKLI